LTPVSSKNKGVEITFDEEVHNFGRVKKGEDVEHTFRFTNTGGEPITIELVSGCECSEITYKEGATYKVGERGEIKVVFHSENEELGKSEKSLDILLENKDPKTGYPYVFELRYNSILY
jgi:peptidoglycan-associated lipoprotein